MKQPSDAGLGTIIFAARRTGFVILAADRLTKFPGTTIPPEVGPKIYSHETLPLAIAHAGLTAVSPAPGDQFKEGFHVRDLITEAYDSIKTRADCTIERLIELFKASLVPLVANTRRQFRQQGLPVEGYHVRLFVGMISKSGSELWFLEITEGLAGSRADVYDIGSSREMSEFHESLKRKNDREYYGSHLKDYKRLAKHARSHVQRAIAYEATLDRGVNETPGQGVDVALVNADGAIMDPK